MSLHPVLVGGMALCGILPLQWWNQRRSLLPIQVRAVTDTLLHGLVPAAAVLPLWWDAPGDHWGLPLAAFLAGFLLDFDHAIAFRSLSLGTCSSQERRPFGHSAGAILLGVAGAALASGSPHFPFVLGFGLASHILFDATDASGVPFFYPHLRIVRRVPYGVYLAFLLAGLLASAWIGGTLTL
ncbi:MAG: metal-dependent hydrolase [Planctomycetota bacterium]